MIPFPTNFSPSNLVAFAGIAGVFLANHEKTKQYSHRYWFIIVAFLFMSGSFGVLLYGLQTCLSQIASFAAISDYIGLYGYLSIMVGTFLLVYCLLRVIIRSSSLI